VGVTGGAEHSGERAKPSATTLAAVYDRDGSVCVREVPLPAPDRGELIVRVTACGICSSETMRWYAARKAPFVLGHEPVGVVERCGSEEVAFAPGDRVFVHHHAPCLTCRACMRGDFVQCTTWRATRLVPGGMSQRALVSAAMVRADLLKLPETLDDDAATFVEPLATVVKSVRRANIRRGDRVLVIGLGIMGLLHVMLARRGGADMVAGVDSVTSRRETALHVGAHVVFDHTAEPLDAAVRHATDGAGADVVIVGPGSVEAMDAAAECVAPGGTIVLFTPLAPHERWPLPVHDLYFKDATVVTSYSAGPNDTREALRILVEGLPVGPLISHRFALADAEAAYQVAAGAGEARKVIVYPQK
jgi:L-iditol 2-dehydrogenase